MFSSGNNIFAFKRLFALMVAYIISILSVISPNCILELEMFSFPVMPGIEQFKMITSSNKGFWKNASSCFINP